MRIQGTETLTHDPRLVFETLRDRTPELVTHMPNIEGVTVVSREDRPPEVRLCSRWQGSNTDVPRVLRPFIKRDLLAWDDRAVWDEQTRSCRWEIEAGPHDRPFFNCKGSTTIRPEGDRRTTFSLQGELKVIPENVPGVPHFLARKLQEPLERFIANAISPNLTSIARAVQQFLDQAASRT